MNLIWIVYLISFLLPSKCSRFNIHTEVLVEDGLSPSLKENSSKMVTYESEIIPWLRNHLSEREIVNLNLETINRRGATIPDHPIFKDRKLLFELAELLITKGLKDLGSEVLRFIRSQIYYSSTYTILIEALDLDHLTIFKQVLKLWFPKQIDLLSAIRSLVDLRMGEDRIIELIDVVWERLNGLPEAILYTHFSFILLSAMKGHYVSVFEDILERFPDMVAVTNARLKEPDSRFNQESTSKRKARRHAGSIVHEFCFNLSPKELNQAPTIQSNLVPEHPSSPSYYLPFDHRTRTYPTANLDLLKAMILHGADVNARNDNGMTPLHFAVYLKKPHIVKVLLECGANPTLVYSKYTMEKWVQKYSNEKVKAIFAEYFEEQRIKEEVQLKEREAEKLAIKFTWKNSK